MRQPRGLCEHHLKMYVEGNGFDGRFTESSPIDCEVCRVVYSGPYNRVGVYYDAYCRRFLREHGDDGCTPVCIDEFARSEECLNMIVQTLPTRA